LAPVIVIGGAGSTAQCTPDVLLNETAFINAARYSKEPVSRCCYASNVRALRLSRKRGDGAPLGRWLKILRLRDSRAFAPGATV